MRRALIAATTASLVMTGGGAVAAAGPATNSAAGDTGHAQAVAEAKSILTKAPVLAGSHRVGKAPTSVLKDSPESPGEAGLVTRARYWVTTGSAKSVLAQLTATTPSGFTDAGSGSAGDRAGITLRFADDELTSPPAGIASGDLVIATAPLKDGKVGIGVYGEAAAQPPRPAAEVVPSSVSTASLSWTLSMWDRHALTHTVNGATGRRLVAAFNAMPVSISGPIPCPADFGEQQTATFVSAGHTWVASFGNCGMVQVVRDGQAQKTLRLSAQFSGLMRHDLGIDGPKRRTSEAVPSAVHRARIVRTTPSGTASRTVRGSRARLVIDGFNQLQTVRRGVLDCSASGTTVTATFVGRHSTWVATEGPCELVSVTRNGKPEPALAEDGLWVQYLRQALKH